MIKVFCEICKNDCDKVTYFLNIELISNYATSTKDTGDYTMGHTDAKMKLSLCQECYKKLNFPNIYEVNN